MKRSNTQIRLATEKDVRDIASVHIASWQKIYRGHIPDIILDSLSLDKREKNWRALFKENIKIFVIEKNEHIVGFASICPSRDEDTDPQFCGEISSIYLDPHVWGKGLGKQLCLHVIRELQNQGYLEVIVWVLEENEQARRFYESIGFFCSETTKDDIMDITQISDNESVSEVVLQEIRYYKTF